MLAAHERCASMARGVPAWPARSCAKISKHAMNLWPLSCSASQMLRISVILISSENQAKEDVTIQPPMPMVSQGAMASAAAQHGSNGRRRMIRTLSCEKQVVSQSMALRLASLRCTSVRHGSAIRIHRALWAGGTQGMSALPCQ